MNNTEIIIWDIPFTTLYQREILEQINGILSNPSSLQLFLATPNPEILLASQSDTPLRQTLQHTSINIPDGNGIIWANIFHNFTRRNSNPVTIYLKGISSFIYFLFHQKNETKRFNKAIHGSDLTMQICRDETINKHKIFLLGNSHGLINNVSKLASNKLRQEIPDINIIGHYDSTTEDTHIVEKINKLQPEILFVAFGAPAQEKWITENLSKLPSVKLAMGVGGTFDFIAGIIPRAPSFFRKTGLEWVYRLYRQPNRLARIFRAAIVFPYKIISARARGRH